MRDELLGPRISHYEIIERLGGGGMGVVYKTRDTKLDRTVALKILPAQSRLDDEAIVRSIHEAKAASSLNHPNIGNIYEIDRAEDGRLFIVMAYYGGETLKKRVARGLLLVDEAVDYAVQLAEGLAKAHEAGIVHRDIKPANVIVSGRGDVKLVDFGLAKLRNVSLAQAGASVGDVSYMSPEQVTGSPVDHRTDLWTLGVVLYEMLTGVPPFRGYNADAIIFAVEHNQPAPVRAQRPEVPERLAQIVERLLQKDKSVRYQDAETVVADLRTLRHGPAQGSRAHRTHRTSRYIRRLGFVAGCVLLVLVIALVG